MFGFAMPMSSSQQSSSSSTGSGTGSLSTSILSPNPESETDGIQRFNWADGAHVEACLDTLVQSLKDDPINAYFVGSKFKCLGYAQDEVEGYVKALPRAANFLTANKDQAVALWQLLPQETPSNEFFAGWQRWFKVPLNKWRSMLKLELYYEHQHDLAARRYGQYYYLSFIATAPACRGKGLGGKLISHMTQQADLEGRYCVLEATSDASRRLYERHGFELIEAKSVRKTDPSAPLVYFMVRPPKQALVSATAATAAPTIAVQRTILNEAKGVPAVAADGASAEAASAAAAEMLKQLSRARSCGSASDLYGLLGSGTRVNTNSKVFDAVSTAPAVILPTVPPMLYV